MVQTFGNPSLCYSSLRWALEMRHEVLVIAERPWPVPFAESKIAPSPTSPGALLRRYHGLPAIVEHDCWYRWKIFDPVQAMLIIDLESRQSRASLWLQRTKKFYTTRSRAMSSVCKIVFSRAGAHLPCFHPLASRAFWIATCNLPSHLHHQSWKARGPRPKALGVRRRVQT